MTKILAVIRIRGSKQLRKKIANTMDNFLHLTRKNHLTFIIETPASIGWLQLCKDYVAFAEVSEATVKKVVEKKGRITGDKPVAAKDVDLIVKEIMSGKVTHKSFKKIFRLNPPKGGFEGSIKLPYPEGAIGKRPQASMEKLIESML